MHKFLGFLLLSIFFMGCESSSTRPMVVSTNPWIGYSPLSYAEEKGWLRENNIKLVRTVSLSESMRTFNRGSADVVCGTQYEFLKFKDDGSVILLDRSNGGDVILSNRSVEELRDAKIIQAYLEVDSVNSILLNDFTNKYEIDAQIIRKIDVSPDVSAKLHMKNRATLIVTYDPYNLSLTKRGYVQIASTKDSDLLIVDAIYAPAKTLKNFPKEVDRLNFLIAQSLKALKNNPQEYYKSIKSHLEYKSFSEFKEALDLIIWIYHDHSVVTKRYSKTPTIKYPSILKPHKEGV